MSVRNGFLNQDQQNSDSCQKETGHGTLVSSGNLSTDSKKNIIDMVSIRLTQTKVAAYYKISISFVETIVLRHRLMNKSCVKKNESRLCDSMVSRCSSLKNAGGRSSKY